MKKVKIFSLSLVALFLLLSSIIFVPVEVSAGTSDYWFDWSAPESFKYFVDEDGKGFKGYIYEISADVDGNFEYVNLIPVKEYVNGTDILDTSDYRFGGVYLDTDLKESYVIPLLLRYGSLNAIPDYDRVYVYWNVDSQTFVFESQGIGFVPVFSGETAFVTNVDDPMSVQEILSHIRLIDEEDGDVSHTITITTSDDRSVGFNENFGGAGYQYYYVDHMFEVGNWYLFVKGHDTQGNYSGLKITVLVRDVDVPIITGQSNYNQSYTKKLNVDTILNSLSVSDNYDSDVQIIVETDNYSSNYSQLGSYKIVFSSTDSSGNKGLFEVNVNVIDDIAPVFSGPASILKGKSEVLTVDDIKDMLTANDFIDGEVEITVKEDNYSGKGNRVGTYNVIFQAKDSAGNVGLHEVEITVSDDIPPVFYVDNYFITVEQSLMLTREDIIAILQASGQLNIQSTTNIQFVLNEYEGNETIVGIYGITVKASSVDGSGQIFNLAVQVVEDEEGTVVRPDDPWYKQIASWFVKAWDWLKEPIKENSWIRWGYVVGFAGIILVLGFVRAVSGGGRRFRRRW